jgi:hypothetical protein
MAAGQEYANSQCSPIHQGHIFSGAHGPQQIHTLVGNCEARGWSVLSQKGNSDPARRLHHREATIQCQAHNADFSLAHKQCTVPIFLWHKAAESLLIWCARSPPFQEYKYFTS